MTYWTTNLLITGILSSDVIAIYPLLVNVMAEAFWLLCCAIYYIVLCFTPSEDLLKRCEQEAITLPSATDNKRHLISGVYIPDSSPHATYELLFKELLEMIKDPDIHFFCIILIYRMPSGLMSILLYIFMALLPSAIAYQILWSSIQSSAQLSTKFPQ